MNNPINKVKKNIVNCRIVTFKLNLTHCRNILTKAII